MPKLRGYTGCVSTALVLVPTLLGAQTPQDTVPQDSVFEIEEIRVEVSRLRAGGIPIDRAPLSAQLMSGLRVLRTSHVVVAQGMTELPGVTLADQFGSPFQPDLRFRGFAVGPVVGLPQSMSVFVDGVRVNEPDASQVNFDLMPMHDVERLEVIRGPIGPFGKNTVGGALNIVTRRGSGRPSAEVELRGGYFEEVEGRARVQGGAGDFDFYASGGYYRSNGWRLRNYAEQIQLFGKLGWRKANTDIQVSYTFGNDSIEGPGSLPESWLAGGPLPDDVTDPPNDRRQLQYTGGSGDAFVPLLHFVNANVAQRLGDRWGLNLNAFGRFADFRQSNDNITEADALALTDIASGGTAIQLSHRRGSDLAATFGAEYVRNNVDIEILALPNPAFPGIDPGGEQTELVGTNEDNIGIYSELWWAVNPVFALYGSLRYDYVRLPFNDFLDPSGSGVNEFNQPSGTIGVDYLAPSGLGAFASFGHGFRAPTILEITCSDPEDPCPLPFELGPDPPLDAVKTNTVQAGIRYNRGPSLSAEAVGYWAEVRDDIFSVVDPEQPTRGFFTNLDKTRRQGVELNLASAPFVSVPELRLTGTFAWTLATFQTVANLAPPGFEGEEEEEAGGMPGEEEEELPPTVVQPGDQLSMVPEFAFTLGAEYSPSRWLFRLNGSFVGSQFYVGDESNTETFGKLPSFFILDAYGEYGIGGASIFLRVLNVVDNEYATFGIISPNVRGPVQEVEPFLTPGYPFRIFGGISYRFP